MDAKNAGRADVALDVSFGLRDMFFYSLIPFAADQGVNGSDPYVAKITRRAEEFKDLHEALQRNLQTYLLLTMDVLAGVHQKVKATVVADATQQMVCYIFWGSCLLTSNLAYRC